MSNKYFKAAITDNISLNKSFKLLSLSPLSNVLIPKPGQFYMLQAGDTYDPLLKRPFSIFKIEQLSSRAAEQQDIGIGTLSFLYRIRGRGTRSLSHLKNRDIIDVIGPLGNSYPEPEGDFIAVAGGIGIASLLPLLKRFKKRAYLFYGARNKDELIMADEARALSKEMFIATDDGSKGSKGLITEILKDSSLVTRYSLPIYACGSLPMIKALAQIIEGKEIKCYVSLEEHMACGVGACLGCVVKTNSEYKRICKEGPVFDIEDIVWE